ncbi:MAG: endonuclease/exonuclease/phosphatase family protein [Clostridium sp.]|nr:endonuclease/exonuclease/phosphatase family protein [Clostridium sp.]
MKLITLNTHSLAEPDYENKLKLFARAVLRETPDVIALQEVNQSVDEKPVGTECLRECGFTRCREVELESGENAGRGPDGCGEIRKIGAGDCKGQAEHGVGDWGGNVPVRADNHAFRLAGLLAEGGMPCFWTWVPAKIGYGRYDEEEPFARQWERLSGYLERGGVRPEAEDGELCFLMGDFNAPAGVPGEGYELVKRSGWLDTYELAARRDGGITVGGAIDGWRDTAHGDGMRMDFIWANREISVSRSQVICNGVYGLVVSDHCGVMIECEPGTVPGRGERAR